MGPFPAIPSAAPNRSHWWTAWWREQEAVQDHAASFRAASEQAARGWELIQAWRRTAASLVPERLCEALPQEADFFAQEGLSDNANLTLGTPLVALDQTFRLHSNPGASKTIYLDFTGHTTTGTSWNDATMGSSFVSPAYSSDSDRSTFSTSELTLIQQVWQRVAADFAAFDVNVTTQPPPTDWLIKSSGSDPNYGIRVVITNYGPSSSTAGGIAYINSFNRDTDTPCFVYNTSLLGVSEAVSHEVGHTLGLSHDGTSSTSYYQGHGSGETGWAPIMGVGYYKSVTTWDSGSYYLSNNTGSSANYNRGADDLAIITGFNGFSYLPDLEGSSLAGATPLSLNAGAVSQFGTIQTATDTDWFRFDLLSTGSIDLRFNPYVYNAFLDTDSLWGGDYTPSFATVSDANGSTSWVDNGTNLDLAVQLYASDGTLVTSSNPTGLAASLNLANLAAGSYYLCLDGVGYGNPTSSTPTGYSDVASIGNYLITGSITASDPQPVITLAVGSLAVREDGSNTLLFTFTRSSASSDPLTVNYSVGGTASGGSDYAALPGSVSFAAGSRTATVLVDPTADATGEPDESVQLTLQPGSGYSVGTTAAVGASILDDDGPLITAALNLASVAENSGTPLLLTLTRSFVTDQPLSVDVHLGGTTTLGSDYSLAGSISGTGTVRTLTFAAGSATTTLTLTPTNDTLFEYSESLELTLAARSGYRLGTSDTLVAQITPDGDLPGISLAVSPSSVTENGTTTITYTFSRSGDFSNPLSVSYSVGGSATAGVDYTGLPSTASTQTISFAANASTATLVLDPTADINAESNETVSLTLLADPAYSVTTSSAVTATITNVTPPTVTLTVAPSGVGEQSGGAITYTFSRSVASADPLTVAYSIGGTATNGVDYTTIPTTVTIAANATTASLVVTPIADALSEPQETVALTLSPSASASYVVGTSTPVVATISDQTLPTVTLSVAPASVAEDSSSTLVFSFSRTGDTTDPLTVSYNLGGSATAGSDYTDLPGSGSSRTISFAAGAANATLTVDPSSDTTVEANETVSLTLANGSGYLVGTSGAVTGTISNDDFNTLSFTSAQDNLTGLSGTAESFVLSSLNLALFVSGSTVDRVTNLRTTEDRFDSPSRSTAITPTAAGSVSALTTSGIANRLTTTRFVANGAATFTFGSGSSQRTFLGINDGVAGYQSATDAIIEITGYTGSLSSLLVT